MPSHFSPFTLKGVTFRNGIAVPRIYQYSAVDGLVNGWHRVHLSSLARGGAVLVIVDVTAVIAGGPHQSAMHRHLER